MSAPDTNEVNAEYVSAATSLFSLEAGYIFKMGVVESKARHAWARGVRRACALNLRQKLLRCHFSASRKDLATCNTFAISVIQQRKAKLFLALWKDFTEFKRLKTSFLKKIYNLEKN